MKRFCLQTLTKTLWVRSKIFFWASLAWTLVIAILCLVPFKKFPDIGSNVPNADKYVHATFHFVFTIGWYGYFASREPEVKTSKIRLKTLLTSIVYGILIECAQGIFTTTRQADVKDVLANTTGAILAVALLSFYEKNIKKKDL